MPVLIPVKIYANICLEFHLSWYTCVLGIYFVLIRPEGFILVIASLKFDVLGLSLLGREIKDFLIVYFIILACVCLKYLWEFM